MTKTPSLRRALNLILAPAMWILSSLGMFMSSARSASEFSDMSQNLLVPAGIAFSIWFPIFFGCIAYGIVQAFSKHKDAQIFSDIGWWTVGGFSGVCGWALITAFAPSSIVQWASALIFIPTMLCFVKAMLFFTRRKSEMDRSNRLTTWLPISLISGWTSLAIFLNWTPIAYGFIGASVNLIIPSIIILALALLWAIFIIRKSSGNLAYAFPIIWGLIFLAVKHLSGEGGVTLIGNAAILGILLLIITAYVARKSLRDHKL